MPNTIRPDVGRRSTSHLRILFTCIPGHGHFIPLVPLARAAASAGHEVAFATAEDFCPRVAKAGFAAFPAGLGMRQQLADATRAYPGEASLPPGKDRFEEFVPKMLAGIAAPARAADLVPLVRRWRPDVVVHDEAELAAPVAASAAGVPWASHSVVLRRPEAMAFRSGTTLRPFAARYGVDVGPRAGLYEYLHFDACPPGLQDRGQPPIAVAHLIRNTEGGDTVPGDRLPSWVRHLPERPTVYVTLGLLFNRPDVLAALLAGAAAEMVNVIATVGQENLVGLRHQPPNVHMAGYIPLSLLLPHLTVVVTQGGTSILPSLGAGLPLLVAPQGADQFHNAAACVAAGVGLCLLPGQVKPAAVSSAVHRLLHEASFARAASRVRKDAASMPSPANAVGLLERLAADCVPIPSGHDEQPCHT